ncbi:MAG: hypothetical protein WC989_02865 [Micavibrio sp.]
MTGLIMLAGAATSFAADRYTIAVGATVTIDEHGQCRQVTNPAGQPNARFVSTRTAPEWQSVINNPNGLTMAACAAGQCLFTGTIVSYECFPYDFFGDYSYPCTDAAGHNCNYSTAYAYDAPMPAGYPYRERRKSGWCGGEHPGSITIYQNDCGAPPPADCTGPWGTVAHGASITAYQAASVPHGSSCASQTRTCTNGTLSGTYTHQACTVDPPPAGGTVAMGGAICYASPPPEMALCAEIGWSVGVACSPVGARCVAQVFPAWHPTCGDGVTGYGVLQCN